jgi:transposase
LPKSREQQLALAKKIGQDGYTLLHAIYQPETPAQIRQLPPVEVLRRIWLQQYYQDDDDIYWRTKKKWGQPPAKQMIANPDDMEARYWVNRTTEWTGYKVHLTETCQAEQPLSWLPFSSALISQRKFMVNRT